MDIYQYLAIMMAQQRVFFTPCPQLSANRAAQIAANIPYLLHWHTLPACQRPLPTSAIVVKAP